MRCDLWHSNVAKWQGINGAMLQYGAICITRMYHNMAILQNGSYITRMYHNMAILQFDTYITAILQHGHIAIWLIYHGNNETWRVHNAIHMAHISRVSANVQYHARQ
jgi:hypothetical protein